MYATQGLMRPSGSVEATVSSSITSTRRVDPANPPGGFGNSRFAQGIMVAPRADSQGGNVYLTEDAFAGARGGRGHAWVAPYIPYPSNVTAVPLPPVAGPAPQTCTVTVNVPSLASGQTYWVQFTAHADGQLSATWKTPVAQSAQLLLYPGNPFTGLADPVGTGTKGGSIASQNSSTTTSFSITTAPTVKTA